MDKIESLIRRADKRTRRALGQRDAYKHAAELYRDLLGEIDVIPDSALDLASKAILAMMSAEGLEKTCSKCATFEGVEEWGESGNFWWHCHACDRDFD
jgi:hypothetical protein